MPVRLPIAWNRLVKVPPFFPRLVERFLPARRLVPPPGGGGS
jgi:hypothetical protein